MDEHYTLALDQRSPYSGVLAGRHLRMRCRPKAGRRAGKSAWNRCDDSDAQFL